MTLPSTCFLRQFDTHRLLPQSYSDEPSSALARIAENEVHLSEISKLDGATNDQLFAENNALPGIGIEELVFGVPHARIINAAFTYAHALGGRFNTPSRGTWYAAFEIETSQAEVAFHKTLYLAEVGLYHDTVIYLDYLADFGGEFHDLRNDPRFRACLTPDSYIESQALAEKLLATGSLGIVYSSVRYSAGTCLACFRPAVVSNVRTGHRYQFAWTGQPTPTTTLV
jgi:hypothetical protein